MGEIEYVQKLPKSCSECDCCDRRGHKPVGNMIVFTCKSIIKFRVFKTNWWKILRLHKDKFKIKRHEQCPLKERK